MSLVEIGVLVMAAALVTVAVVVVMAYRRLMPRLLELDALMREARVLAARLGSLATEVEDIVRSTKKVGAGVANVGGAIARFVPPVGRAATLWSVLKAGARAFSRARNAGATSGPSSPAAPGSTPEPPAPGAAGGTTPTIG